MSVGLATLGALVGGSTASAVAYADYRAGRIGSKRAVLLVCREAAGLGVSTAVGVAVAGALGGGAVPWVVTLFATTAGAKYVWDRGVDRARNAVYVAAARVAFQRAAKRERASANPK